MKRLIIIRHAKSSWEDPSLEDHDRPLNKRGIKAANLMGHFLKEKNLEEILFVSSPAKRAFATAQIMHTLLECKNPIQINTKLYTFSDNGMVFLNCLKTISEHIKTICLFSHNDTCYHFVHRQSEGNIEKFPTCAAASFVVNSPTWPSTKANNLLLEFCQFPKEL